jgi:hypothetical protein
VRSNRKGSRRGGVLPAFPSSARGRLTGEERSPRKPLPDSASGLNTIRLVAGGLFLMTRAERQNGERLARLRKMRSDHEMSKHVVWPGLGRGDWNTALQTRSLPVPIRANAPSLISQWIGKCESERRRTRTSLIINDTAKLLDKRYLLG